MSFNKKVALVTGASSGIGAAIALKFSEKGAGVAIVARNENKLNNVSKACEQRGSKPLVIVADVSKDNDVKKMMSSTINHFGKLDVLVNNAGIFAVTKILAQDAMQVFDHVMSINLRSAVCATSLAAPHLIKTKGNIINISSIAASVLSSNVSFSYSTSKAGLDHFTRCAALELAPKGVRVNNISPGPVKTDIVKISKPTKRLRPFFGMY